ncbi:MAG TPA: twin-arginine translocation signal domain-containing protein [Candidatus Thermoplasmatota archaeon]|nr:twin-arginine translocation signal domain-containing protein [Candidatus Thermoplasmatota archaeon]
MERDEPLDMPEPRRFSRRAFVKGCIYASAAGVAAVGAGATVIPLAMTSKAPFRRIEYIGATLISGPAPQGVPLLPLKANADGNVAVNPAPEGVEGGVLEWYKYCSHENTVGLQQGFKAKDEFIRFFLTEEKKHTIVEGWYLDKIGNIVNVRDFDAVGKGAGFNWRSEGQSGKNIISGIIIKIDPTKMDFSAAADKEDVVRNGFLVPTPDGNALIAYSSFCKHFCCVPGWHESTLAQAQGFWEKIFCTCHLSTYDPYLVKADFYMLQAELEEAA